jgi:hypothetical protein
MEGPTTFTADVNFFYAKSTKKQQTTQNRHVFLSSAKNVIHNGQSILSSYDIHGGRESPDLLDVYDDTRFSMIEYSHNTCSSNDEPRTPLQSRRLSKRTPTSTKRTTRSNTPASTKRTKNDTSFNGRVLRSNSKKHEETYSLLDDDHIDRLTTTTRQRCRRSISKSKLFKIEDKSVEQIPPKIEMTCKSAPIETSCVTSIISTVKTRKRKSQHATFMDFVMTPLKRRKVSSREIVSDSSLSSFSDDDLRDLDDSCSTASEEDICCNSQALLQAPGSSKRKSVTPSRKMSIKKKGGRPRKDGNQTDIQDNSIDRTNIIVTRKRRSPVLNDDDSAKTPRKIPRARPLNHPKHQSTITQAVNKAISSVLFLRRNILPARCCRKSRGRYSLFVILKTPILEKRRAAQRKKLDKSKKMSKSTSDHLVKSTGNLTGPADQLLEITPTKILRSRTITTQHQITTTPSVRKKKLGRPKKTKQDTAPRVATPRKNKKKNIRKALFT